jgi:hypothetical protein
VTVVIVDLAGAGALALALTHRSANAANSSQPVAVMVAHPQAPQTMIGDPTAQTTTTTPSPKQKPTAPKRLATLGRKRPSQPPADTASAPSGAQASFDQFARTLPGTVGLAIAPLGQGPVVTFGSLQVGHAWSTMKVPVLTTVLRELEASGSSLSPQGRGYAQAALEHSDNSAAEALFSGLEQTDGGLTGASGALQGTLRAAGDQTTTINTSPNSGGFTTWGQSLWSATGEVTFYRSLARGCMLAPADTQYVLGLMSNVESDQRWGAGSAGFPAGTQLQFKGGWGPENGGGYLVRQTAIVGSGDRGYVLSMLARASDGSYSSGAHLLTQVASWVAHSVSPSVSHPGAGC